MINSIYKKKKINSNTIWYKGELYQNVTKEKYKQSKTKPKYTFPITVSTVLVVLCLILRRYRRKDVGVPSTSDLSNLGAPIRISYYELLQAIMDLIRAMY